MIPNNYIVRCTVCRRECDTEDCVVDIDKSGRYIYYCDENCYENNLNRGHKNDRAERNARRKAKYEYDSGE